MAKNTKKTDQIIAQAEELPALVAALTPNSSQQEVSAITDRVAPLSRGKQTYFINDIARLTGQMEGAVKDAVAEKAKAAKPNQKELAVRVVEGVELWRNPQGVSFASYQKDDHVEHVQVESKFFKTWVRYVCSSQYSFNIGADALRDAIDHANAKAIHEGAERRDWLRVAEHDDTWYLDLGDDDWTVIEIDKKGWRVARGDLPVKLCRRSGYTLPMPVKSGKLEQLRPFLNVGEDDFILLVASLVAAFRPDKPFPIVDLAGPAGTAKSTVLTLMRSLIDPAPAATRGLSKTEDDLVVTALNNWVVSGDNISGVNADMADALCRLATGGEIGKRQLYTDADEFIIDAMRPVILTGINTISTRNDLLDRLVLLNLKPLDASERKTTNEIFLEWEKVRPKILGVLLDGVSTALRRLSEVHFDKLPRMADFALWAEAAAPAFGWQEGAFMAAYDAMQGGLMATAARSDVLSRVIIEYVTDKTKFYSREKTDAFTLEGYGGAVLKDLEIWLGDEKLRDLKYDKHSGWPKNDVWFGRRLRLAIPGLTAVGITVSETLENKRAYFIISAPMKPDVCEIPF